MNDRPIPGRSPSQGGRSRALVWPLAIFAVLAAIFAFALKSGDPSRLPSALIGKPAPPTDLPALEGLTANGRAVGGFSSAELASGQVTVVNFWASWCGPCVQEHPLLVALGKRTGVRIYGVNYKDQAAAARRFLGRYGNPYVAVGVDGNGRAAIEWGVYGMPETFIVGGDGRILYKHVGPITAEALEARIIPAIRSAPAR
ncbi:MAG TPA: DsbE family thiol:disulfide interchange protein [Hyphomicrobiaceae bacterium]|nr:DsbE family thiol:disulfide interchange protein [Hyphomicrobiaceae bacterium]